MRLLFFGTYDARRHPRVLVLREGLEALGDEVVECNVPLGLDTASRVRILRRPWLLPVFLVRLAGAWWKLRRAARRRAAPVDAVVVGYMGHFDVRLARRLWRKTPIVLDHLVSAKDTALDRGASGGLLVSALDRLDRGALAACDIPVVDTEEHRSLLPAEAGRRAVVVPVGAPAAWFARPRPIEGVLRVVFFGLYTPLQGTAVIGEALGLLAREDRPVSVTMVGTGQDLDAARRAAAGNPRVRWLEWIEPEGLPALVADHHVCLGIFGTGPKALRVVPNKVYQGAAAGCAIVTSDTPPQRAALGDAAVFVAPGDGKALAGVLGSLAADPDRVRALREAAYALADARFRPEAVVAPLRDRLAASVVG